MSPLHSRRHPSLEYISAGDADAGDGDGEAGKIDSVTIDSDIIKVKVVSYHAAIVSGVA